MQPSDTERAVATRRVRPWIAALLTFLGWGLGFFYAGKTGTAVRLVIANAVVGIVLGVAMFVVAMRTNFVSLALEGTDWTPFDTVSVAVRYGIASVIAVFAWIAAAKERAAPRAGSIRLWGYFAVCVAPVAAAALVAMVVRFGIVQPFRMPSGSMQPTIQVGEYFFVNKRSYGYSRFSFSPFHFGPPGRVLPRQPKRGDLVVFRPDTVEDRDFVKRLIGLPGDRVQIVDGALLINGVAVKRQSLGKRQIAEQGGEKVEVEAFAETLPNGVTYTTFDRFDGQGDHTAVYTVPTGRYFMLGDDRDNSSDSRAEMGGFGYVSFDHLVGRVDRILRSHAVDLDRPGRSQ